MEKLSNGENKNKRQFLTLKEKLFIIKEFCENLIAKRATYNVIITCFSPITCYLVYLPGVELELVQNEPEDVLVLETLPERAQEPKKQTRFLCARNF